MATPLGGLRLEREFERLYTRHRHEVYRAVLREVRNADEAEDVTQIAFLDAYRALQRGDAPLRPRAWLLAIAQNAARRRYRVRAAGPREVELQADLLVAPDDTGPTAVEIRQAFARLTSQQRKALVLREIAGRSYAEIAAALDLSLPAVETLIFRARAALRRELSGWEPPAKRRARLGGLLVWPPAPLGDTAGSLAGWIAGSGPAAKLAGGLSVVVLGTGIALEGSVPRPAEPPRPSPMLERTGPTPAVIPAVLPAGIPDPARRAGGRPAATTPLPPALPTQTPVVESPPLAVSPAPLPAVSAPAAPEIVPAPPPELPAAPPSPGAQPLLHAEDAEGRLGDGAVQRGRDPERDDPPRVDGVDHSVVP